MLFDLSAIQDNGQNINSAQMDLTNRKLENNTKDSVTLIDKIGNLERLLSIQNKPDEIKVLLPTVTEKTIQMISIFFFVITCLLVLLFFVHIHIKKQYLGFQSIKYIGLAIMFPGICIIALVGQGQLISESTLAALLGTIAGYVLSREYSSKGTPKDDITGEPMEESLNELKKNIEDLKKNELKLKAEIESLNSKISIS